MAESASFEFSIETPHGVVFRGAVRSVRARTESGLVGIRPKLEPMVLAVEAGLLIIRDAQGERFAATSGGLLQAERDASRLLTPYAAVGTNAEEMDRVLQTLSDSPPEEVLARRRLEELEERVINELSQKGQSRRGAYGR